MPKYPLDIYDRRPEDMDMYLAHNGWHFSKNMCEWAIKKMRKFNPATQKKEPIEKVEKEKVNEILAKYGVTLKNNVKYDYIYAYHMGMAGVYKSSVSDEQHLALFVRDVIDHPDKPEGYLFNHFFADMTRAGEVIEWEDLI